VSDVTLTTSLLEVSHHHRLVFDIVHLHAKFDVSGFSLSLGATKFKMGHVTLTTCFRGRVVNALGRRVQ